jgi:hypothetical protein
MAIQRNLETVLVNAPHRKEVFTEQELKKTVTFSQLWPKLAELIS